MSADQPEVEEKNPYVSAEKPRWEWWAKLSIVLASLLGIAWLLVFLRLGQPSTYAHGIAIPTLGFLTVPIMFWGLIRTFFSPPAIQRPRTIAFALLLLTGYLGNVPVMAPPLSTEDWQPETPYRLPFDGEWYTLAGGDSLDTNYHGTTPTYRWGYDFSVAVDGKRHQLDGKANPDYYCFGKPVLAPIAGEVVAIESTVPDNVPGDVPPRSTLGNHVILKVRDGEFVFLAHMKEDSLAVKHGDQVQAGQRIGECGNSGRSIEPHVHVHAQNTKEFPYSESLPLRFSNYEENGELVDLGMPSGSTSWEANDGARVKALP